MTTATSRRAAAPAPGPGYSDDTAPRIRAYLASMRPLLGGGAADSEEYHRGRSLIERLALSARGEDAPILALSRSQCADVLHFIWRSEPIEPAGWWEDPEDAPSHVVGFDFVLQALESSLRARGRS